MVTLGKRTKSFNSLYGTDSRSIQTWRTAAGFNADIRGNPLPIDVKDKRDTFAIGGDGICLLRIPVLRHGTVDDVDIVGKAGSEGAILHVDAGSTILHLHGCFRD